MSCADRDEQIVLYAHGELGILPAARLRLHLKSCVRCRERLQTIAATSTTLRAVLNAGPDSYTPKPVFFGRTAFQAVRGLILAALAIAVIGAVWIVGHRIAIGITEHGRTPIRGDVPCNPSLPNDRCR